MQGPGWGQSSIIGLDPTPPRAVAIGRPSFYGLAVSGADGVRSVVNVLRNEVVMAMALTGRPTIASIDRSLILRAAGFPKG